jgi:mannose-1-phosphate guanylyltransferase / phosphomannomutase
MEKKVVFIDRDGVICEEEGLLSSKEKIRLIKGSAKAIKLLNDNGFLVIVVTNQPVVARGLCTEEDLESIHKHLNNLIQLENNALINEFFFCPHHPKEGIDPRYTCDCDCRKPKPGMIFKAAFKYDISKLENCYMVGDKIGDIKAGRDAGCKTILVKTGYGGKEGFTDAVPDYISEDLLEAVKKIILKI